MTSEKFYNNEIELFLKKMGDKIKAIRKEKEISIRELGELCKLDYNILLKIESGKEDTDLLTLFNIADKLDVDVRDFM
ncbi:MAG: helix-turn-helix transcriptional regulator [Ginsengibacter sp.]